MEHKASDISTLAINKERVIGLKVRPVGVVAQSCSGGVASTTIVQVTDLGRLHNHSSFSDCVTTMSGAEVKQVQLFLIS
jgi:hypothetical protein